MKVFDAEFTAYRDLDAEGLILHSRLAPDRAVFRRWGLVMIATRTHDWDHVSVSTATRTPTWDEMERVKRWLFEPHEVAMQLHVAPKDHVNTHPYCLHLWRPQMIAIPLLPSQLV